ncbi:MAG: glycosyltransferase [Lachnospiraceae bacterium]|nr:glycosyltransferase [Lachnospiraceae bacterium]
MTPLITIIVPVYNIMEYLPRCVHSITAQTYTNLEVILVDDGSTDGTGMLCDELAKEDSRILVLHKENGGSSSARNLGLSAAKGAYIGFIDSDDYVEPDMYEKLLAGIQNYQVQVAQIGRDEIDMQGNRLPNICEPPEREQVIAQQDFLKELLMHRGDCSFCTKLFARELLMDREFPVGVLNEDFHLLVKLLPKIGNIVSLPGQAYHVFCREGSNTRKQTGFSRVFADNIDNADMVAEMVENNAAISQRQVEECGKSVTMTEIAFRFGVFQRIDYMLHIPIEQMVKENEFYMRVKRYLRANLGAICANSVLTAKNKIYAILFGIAPKTIRTIHKKLKRAVPKCKS